MKRKKRALTLLEIIIVIFLITLITGAIGYNMKGALDRGRLFRTEQGKEQLHQLLLMCLEEGEKGEEIVADPVRFLDRYSLAKDSKKIIQDGWGDPFVITFNRTKRDFEIGSANWTEYNKKLGKNRSLRVDEEEGE